MEEDTNLEVEIIDNLNQQQVQKIDAVRGSVVLQFLYRISSLKSKGLNL